MQDVATDALDHRSSRSKGLRETIWAYLRKQWKEAFRAELTSRRSQALFRRSREQDIETVAVEVFRLMQQVPDGCEDPQTVLFNLTRTVVERNESEPAMRLVSTSAAQSLAAGEALLQQEIEGFDRKTRKLLGLHVNAGVSYRQIAMELGMSPEQVLRILTQAYCQLRLRVDPIESAPIESSDETRS